MIVTTENGRYRVEEQARGWFLFTLLDLKGQHVPGLLATVRHGPVRLRAGLGLCFDGAGVQLVDCGCNRIVAVAP